MSKEQPKPRYRVRYVDFGTLQDLALASPILDAKEFLKAHYVETIYVGMLVRYQFISKLS